MLGLGQEAIQPRAYTSGSEVRLSALNVSSTPSTALGKLVDLSNTQLHGLHQGQQMFSIEGQGVTSTGFGGVSLHSDSTLLLQHKSGLR